MNFPVALFYSDEIVFNYSETVRLLLPWKMSMGNLNLSTSWEEKEEGFWDEPIWSAAS
jgi:hypothetical protein